MSKEETIRNFLKRRYIACIATENEDRSLHMTSVWYLHRDERLYVGTNSRSKKARNVLARPRAGIIIDARRSAHECGVSTYGPARIIHGDASRELNSEIRSRYLSKAATEDPRVVPVFEAIDDITIEITPGRWIWWDTSVVDTQFFGGILGANNYILPLDG